MGEGWIALEIKVIKNILKANEDLAGQNRNRFDELGLFVLNLISSPGAGKTTILEKTIEKLKSKIKLGVIEGDLMTTRDAERILSQGVPVVQINTQGGCHLDANMISKAMNELPLESLQLLIIENVGNLVCPAAYDLGEHTKVAVLSVSEGDDKPLKYPKIFQEAPVCILNKMTCCRTVISISKEEWWLPPITIPQ